VFHNLISLNTLIYSPNPAQYVHHQERIFFNASKLPQYSASITHREIEGYDEINMVFFYRYMENRLFLLAENRFFSENSSFASVLIKIYSLINKRNAFLLYNSTILEEIVSTK
jgi:hypothetical protein